MATLFRFLFLIPLGFIAATVAAAFALLWPFLDPGALAASDPAYLAELAVGFLAQVAQIGSVVLLPWAVFMVATEVLGLSSILLHVAAGFLGGIVLSLAAYGTRPPALSVQTAIVVASLSFALVYWIVAGHAAGRWRRRFRREPAPPVASPAEPPPLA
ncbi:hypothetical protein [Antarcticirhabdus aurantiaca]|uniref:Uncharacterized protein n=1 Tax=Antarcticirhabdus aurantiaca TaxID=2606717 RepID=A0ACD4NQQ5_9HYPH|nr:hypothetical protein [Antarcticirhabdus aurantiaca]WAJ29066.1 hypothetical protein OXU80_02120 [Jeongeuplla avenae]